MTNYEKYGNKKAIASYGICNMGALVLYDIIYDVDDYAVTAFEYGQDKWEPNHFKKTKIRYNNSGEPYIERYGVKYPLDLFMRCS